MNTLGSLSLSSLLGVGTLMTLVGGIILAWVKQIPQRLWEMFLNRFTVCITVRDNDPLFPSFLLLSQKKENMGSCRRLLAQSEDLCSDSWGHSLSSARDNKKAVLLTRAPGQHFLKYKNKWLSFTRIVDNSKQGVGRPVESIILRALGTDRSFLEGMFLDAKSEVDKTSSKTLSIRIPDKDGNWIFIRGCGKRKLDSVILREGLLEQVVSDLDRFMHSEEFYQRTGTPYHRGYLLEGPPGGGKSSLVQALATHFKSDLFVLCLNEIHSDATLRNLIGRIPEGSFLLIEDVDTSAFALSRKGLSEEMDLFRGLSLGGFLNVLDGIFSKSQLVIFMTTNHPEKLDAALVRAGRVDVRVKLDFASFDQAGKLYLKFFPDAPPSEVESFSEQTKEKQISMAELQEQMVSKAFSERPR